MSYTTINSLGEALKSNTELCSLTCECFSCPSFLFQLRILNTSLDIDVGTRKHVTTKFILIIEIY